MLRIHPVCFCVGVLLITVFGSCTPVELIPPTDGIDLTSWQTASPKEVGMNKKILSNAVEKAEDIPRFLSLLVVKNGHLVLEEYFHGNHADSLNDVRSVTKSVVSTLTGIALKEGYIQTLEETIDAYWPESIAPLSDDQKSIRIRDLLTMSSGFEWEESGSIGYNDWFQADDKIKYLLDQPMSDAPGETFAYNSPAVHLLGVVLEEATNMRLAEFADRYLFSKIGIKEAKWHEFSDGYVNGGSGIDLRPRDLARLGQFFLQNGKNKGVQILPEYWVDEATRPVYDWRTEQGAATSISYGYLWWTEDMATKAYFAWGYGGQFVFVVPEHQLVVITTIYWGLLSQDGGPEPMYDAALDIIINEVLRAVED
ncbi:MAG: serine hydrolase [Bacteroidota bacterium]